MYNSIHSIRCSVFYNVNVGLRATSLEVNQQWSYNYGPFQFSITLTKEIDIGALVTKGREAINIEAPPNVPDKFPMWWRSNHRCLVLVRGGYEFSWSN